MTDSQRWWWWCPTAGVTVALGFLVAGIQLVHYATLVEFTYHVAATTQSAAADAARSAGDQTPVVYQFADLPATAQDAFLRAHESANDRTTIRGTAHQVTALSHTGDTPARPGAGRYYVVYRGSYYEFLLRRPMSVPGPGVLLGYAFTGIGLLYGAYTSLTDEPRTRAFLALVAGVACFLAVYGLTDWWGRNGLPSLLAAGALCAYLPAIGAWAGYEALRSRLRESVSGTPR